ncbi:MAG TPA: ATP-binding protein [Candidatus Acidoferrum sp.]|nr:ATP-binding protein [Candidatus Acidoferrum sp.]
MAFLFYIRLIGLTAGTLVYLFLLALILGHRRPRKFERLLFLLALALFAIYGGGLLEMNAQIQYGAPPEVTRWFYRGLIGLGLLLLLPLVWHAHHAYRRQIRGKSGGTLARVFVVLLYMLLAGEVAFGLSLFAGNALSLGTRTYVVLSFFLNVGTATLPIVAGLDAIFEFQDWRAAQSREERGVFRSLFWISAALCALLTIYRNLPMTSVVGTEAFFTMATVTGVLPGAAIIYYALKHNFLEYGAQRNLVYALSATFLALLYLALVHRVSGWLAPVFPPEATASVLLFVLLFLFEPLERAIGPVLHRRMSERMVRVQKLTVEIQQEARQGHLARLVAFAERRVRGEFGLAAVKISLPRDAAARPLEIPGGLGHAVRLPLMKDGQEIGLLEAVTTGTYITGETSAALEFLAEQLPGMIDLCRLIEEKLRLERELAERERLALLGQIAASVSHNLRNPLSSMKTILQVQLEKENLPFDIRHDCALVVGEIDRMSAKLTQLLKFAKPSVNGQTIPAVALAKQTAALFSRDAERRNVRLEFDCPSGEVRVIGSEEALSEALSNLIVNAIEAQPNGGRVRVGITENGGWVEIRIEDDGPGIPTEARTKIFQPFFTTKATGTGLGLSIVARRAAEMGGTIRWESPVRDGRGARFRLTLLIAGEEGKRSDANDSDRGR